jgi:hypothetical protein
MKMSYRTPDLSKRAFARTNPQTIAQRVAILRELLPGVKSIAEICCGDCSQQLAAYRRELGVEVYRGLDIQPEIVAANRALGIDCVCGDALAEITLRQFLAFEVIFFGPPLSIDCDGHQLLSFREVTPGYTAFVQLLLGEFGYNGTLVCICPKATTMGDVRRLYHQVRALREDFGLRLVYSSYATVTGEGDETEPRLKYLEVWFPNRLEDSWEIRNKTAVDN